MEKNFMSIAEKIEKRELLLIKALEEEAKAIDQAETKLGIHYQESVKNAYNLSLNSMQEQERELKNELESMNTNISKQTEKIYKVVSDNLTKIQSKAQQSQSVMERIVNQKIKITIWLNLSFLGIGLVLGGILVYLLSPTKVEIREEERMMKLNKNQMILEINESSLKYHQEVERYYYWLTKEDSLKMKLSIEQQNGEK